MERRFLPQPHAGISLRDDHGTQKIVGVASVFFDGTRDTEFELWPGVFERIMPGTFDRASRADEPSVVALFNHNPTLLLGRTNRQAGEGTLRLSTDKVGLNYDVDVADTTTSRDVVEHITRGDLEGSSFGFQVMGEDWRTEDGVEIREITDVRLFDVSPVTFPAYTATSTGVRDAAGAMAEARASYDAWKARNTPVVRHRLLAAKRALPGVLACD